MIFDWTDKEDAAINKIVEHQRRSTTIFTQLVKSVGHLVIAYKFMSPF